MEMCDPVLVLLYCEVRSVILVMSSVRSLENQGLAENRQREHYCDWDKCCCDGKQCGCQWESS